jgi:hypothetical protein
VSGAAAAADREDDDVERRLARSRVVLPAGDLDHLRSARLALDAARSAVAAAAARLRIDTDRPWPLPSRR